MVIDLHCHYTFSAMPPVEGPRFSFEPPVENGVGTFDSYVSPRAVRSLSWRLMRRALGIPTAVPAGPPLDRYIVEFYRRHLAPIDANHPESIEARQRCIDRTVLLAFDAYHDDAGRRMPPPENRSQLGSDIYTSNTLIRHVCSRGGGRFLFGASVHPYRPDAVACVEEVFNAGACLLKWIPLHQNIDVADGRTIAVLRCCARLGLPLLLHYSEEFTLATQHREFQDVSTLLSVLRNLRRDGCMPPVIVAHVGTPVTPLSPMSDYDALVDALLGDMSDAPLYADVSALTAWGKVRFLRQIVRRQELHRKLMFGSDFPVPVAMWRMRRDLGREYKRIRAIESWPEQVLAIYRHMGFNEIVFHRAGEFLPHVSRFDQMVRAQSPTTT